MSCIAYAGPLRGFVSIYQGDALTAKGRANTIRLGTEREALSTDGKMHPFSP